MAIYIYTFRKIQTLTKKAIKQTEKKYIKIHIYKHVNIQIHRNACRKSFIWNYERVYEKQKVWKYIKCIKNVYRKKCYLTVT